MADIRDVITIDGPAGSGKSTLAKNLAQSLGWDFLDTGSLYRLVAYVVARDGGEGKSPAEILKILESERLDIVLTPNVSRVFCGDTEVTDLIRTPFYSKLASDLSALKEVRGFLLATQKTLGAQGKLVTEGRDQGTVVFPEARLKFFLTASPEERARRRQKDLEDLGEEIPFAEILADINLRDHNDSTRTLAPLRQPLGAVMVDSTQLTLAEVLSFMMQKAKEVFGF
ncbi:MAG: (d)CMP kinase [Deltaproteobacteria bacterium]|jgi:cytidylate kinase|nr:(d)CMP kinase [Deltaproteobacteria bacterium]